VSDNCRMVTRLQRWNLRRKVVTLHCDLVRLFFSFWERKDELKDKLNSEKIFDYKLAEERKTNTLSCIECDDVLCSSAHWMWWCAVFFCTLNVMMCCVLLHIECDNVLCSSAHWMWWCAVFFCTLNVMMCCVLLHIECDNVLCSSAHWMW